MRAAMFVAALAACGTTAEAIVTSQPYETKGAAVVAAPAVRVRATPNSPQTSTTTTTATVPAPPVAVDGDCESWRPLLERYRIPYDEARPVMWRESRCTHASRFSDATRDESWGVLQVNRYGRLDDAWTAAGYPREWMSTREGAVAAAAFLYHHCGWGPWTKPYTCPGGWPLHPVK